MSRIRLNIHKFLSWKVLLVLASLFSGWATFNGFVSVAETSGWRAIVLALGAALILQMLLAKLVASPMDRASLRQRLVHLAKIGFLWLISVGFAYAYWWNIMNGRSYSEQSYAQSTDRLKLAVRNFAISYAEMSDALAQLADYSHAKAEQEVNDGYTCGNVGPGNGERAKLRRKDATIFMALAQKFQRKTETMNGLLRELEESIKRFTPEQAQTFRQKLRNAAERARVLSRDPDLEALRVTLKERLRLHNEGFYAGKEFVKCKDQDLELLVNDVLMRADSLPLIEIENMRVVGADRKTAVEITYNRLLQIFSWLIGTGEKPLLDGKDLLPLLLAFLPDMAILLAGRQMARERMERPLVHRPTPPRVVDEHGRETSLSEAEEMFLAISAEGELLRRYMARWDADKTFVFVPLRNGDPEVTRLRALLDKLEYTRMVTFYAGTVRANELSDFHQHTLPKHLQSIEMFHLYTCDPLLPVYLDLLLPRLRAQKDPEASRAGDTAPAAGREVTRLSGTPACSEGSCPETPPVEVVLEADERGYFHADVCLNGKAETRMLVDTGATAISLSWEDARKAGLDMKALKFTRPVATANGMALVADARLESLCVQGIWMHDVRVTVAQPDAREDSLLGMAFLKRLAGFEVKDGRMILRPHPMRQAA